MIEMERKMLGAEHPDTLMTCHNLALVLAKENRPDNAKVFAQRAADDLTKVLGASHPQTLEAEQLWHSLQTSNVP